MRARVQQSVCAMGKKPTKRFYAVRVGRNPGIYTSWPEASKQVTGFKHARFKGFREYDDACQWMCEPTRPPAEGTNAAAAAAAAGVGDATGESVDESKKRRRDSEMSERCALLYFDGGARMNGYAGPAGAGASLFRPEWDTETAFVSEYVGEATNNQAEYRGLIAGLQLATEWLDNATTDELHVYGDSKLVCSQMSGMWRVRNPELVQLYNQSVHLVKALDPIVVRFWHVARAQNKRADELANLAMDQRESFAYSADDQTAHAPALVAPPSTIARQPMESSTSQQHKKPKVAS